jgi:hypothetical protein
LKRILPSLNHSPPPLLLPTSPLKFAHPSIPSISAIQHEETHEKKLNAPSIIAAPLSPSIPLNSSYLAH